MKLDIYQKYNMVFSNEWRSLPGEAFQMIAHCFHVVASEVKCRDVL